MAPPAWVAAAGTDERRSAMEEAYRKKVLDVIENIAGAGRSQGDGLDRR